MNFGVNAEIDNYSNGKEFLLNTKKYDIVFMDIEMPYMDGFDTIKIKKCYGKLFMFGG